MPFKKMTSSTFTYLTYRKVEKKVPALAQCRAPKTKLKCPEISATAKTVNLLFENY